MAELKVPVPPTEVEVNWMLPAAGRPEGLRLPNASLVVRVAVRVEPELKEAEERDMELVDTE
ncbi:MAG: hypothetical protein EBS53_14855 [Bacteroidetes bacterium]|nr:hypothetical protein [Bacteroidota bacterium]